MARNAPSTSRMALLRRLILWALCANASQHLSHGYACDAKMICTTREFAETLSIFVLRGGPHVWNMTDAESENVLMASSRKLNQRCSKGSSHHQKSWNEVCEGFFTCACNVLKQDEYEKQDSPEGLLCVCRTKHKCKHNLLKGDALYELKAKRTLRIPTTTGASGKEGTDLRHARHDEDSIFLRDGKSSVPFFFILCTQFWPAARDDFDPWMNGAKISDPPKNDYHDVETPSLEAAVVSKQGSDRTSECLVICKPWKGLSWDDKLSYLRGDPLNHTATAKVIAHVDHVHENIHFEVLSSLQHGRQSLNGRRRLFEVTPAVAPVEAPVVSPVASPPPIVMLAPPPEMASPPPPMNVLAPPPEMASPPPPMDTLAPPPKMASPPPPMNMIAPPEMASPPPPMDILAPPPKMASPPPPMDILAPPPEMASPPPPPVAYAPFPPPPPPIASFDFVPPDEVYLLRTTITAPDSYNINNQSVYTTGVDIPIVNVSPSSILLLEVAFSKRVDPVKLPTLHDGKKSSGGDRRLFEIAPTMRRLFQAPSPAPAPAPIADWYPKTQGISQGLTCLLQVDAGSLLILLPGYLVNHIYTWRQATVNGDWVPVWESSDPWIWIPGPGIQFLGSIDEINAALLTLEFGLSLGTGKATTVTLTVDAAHLFDNLTVIDQTRREKKVKMNIAAVGTLFVITQYAKTFYQHSLGVLCFFALVLVILCCILGCCMCHDAKMEKIFQKNRTVLKAEVTALKENRVFNPVWVPSAPVVPGRKRFVVVHNPKFLQQRLADHLSSLHGALVEKVTSNMGFNEQFRRKEDMHDVSDMDPFSSHISTGFSEPEGLSHGLASRTTPAEYSDDDGGSQSTHYTIQDDRNLGSPLSPGGFSGGSDSTHYDIGSPSGGESDY